MTILSKVRDDDSATIFMIDSNLQRENILPSERARAYRMKMDAIRRKAGRPTKENSRQVGGNLESAEIVGREAGEIGRQVQRYLRLNYLCPQLLQMVDEKKIAMTPAVELSYLKPEEQAFLLETIDSEQVTPSISQVQRRKSSANRVS